MAAGGFIDRHGLWSDAQKRAAEELTQRLNTEPLRLVRIAWADPHGASRAKAVTPPAFLAALSDGYNINVATSTLDSANARIFNSFTRGGGMGLEEMTGSRNLTIVPDPTTFPLLPWAPGVGWVLCDEYFNTGTPFHFSPRHALRRQLQRLRAKGWGHVVGLEVEWYLLKLAEDQLGDRHIGAPGVRGEPLATIPPEPGYSYHSESNMDLMQPMLTTLAESFAALDLPLRSIENEWGPGQVECTFAARDALQAADDMLLFRTATRQICRRNGFVATFMARPALKGYYASGWHLHQSVVEAASGRNLFAPERMDALLSPMGLAFLGGLLRHAAASSAFATPTVNGYRRYQPFSLAPDRATWGYDHRGAMVRVLGGPGNAATRMENRMGEPAADPYLYIASQLVAGLDGVEHALDPGPQDLEPYTADRPLLPKTLGDALDALERSGVFREALGGTFLDYFLKLKRTELARFTRHLEELGLKEPPDEPTQWEQNEYFDFF